jgi:beta-mannosidase
VKRIDLAGEWTLRRVATDEAVPASVPGDNYSALLRAGKIPDPYYGTQEDDVQWVAEQTWVFEREFEVDASWLEEASVYLSCDSLDTLAEVRVNDQRVGTSDNMFVRQRYEVKSALRAGQNRVSIRFQPAAAGIAERVERLQHPVPAGAVGKLESLNLLRKVQCHGGWDWGPCLPVSGIYGDIHLGATSLARIEYVTCAQSHEPGRCTVDVTVQAHGVASGRARLGVRLGQVETAMDVDVRPGPQSHTARVVVDQPELWWPAGQGAQPLYELTVTLGEQTVRRRLGLRTLEVTQEAGLTFRINGRDVFCKGANWVPAGALPTEHTPERYRELLGGARSANMNMLRVWGGGQYESDLFYDLCDELGILIWQDFMFACSPYPWDDWFCDSVREEVKHQVRRLRDHACIAIWCGDNEVLHSFAWNPMSRDNPELYAAGYARLNSVIAEAARESDPERVFWPGSPSNGPGTRPRDCNDPGRGDVHYWDVWHGDRGFEAARTVAPRFCSEFGFQSFPAMEAIRRFCPEEQWSPTSPVMNHHQRSPNGNERIVETMERYFRRPESFESFVWLSQILQGLGIKSMVEYWRTLRPRCMGTLYWQLNDVWPVASWSSVEHSGRFKPLHYLARRFYKNLLVTTVPHDGQVEVWVVSDESAPTSGEVVVETFDLDGNVVATDRYPVELAGAGAVKVGSLPTPSEADSRFLVLTARLGELAAYNWHFVEPYKHYDLPSATVHAEPVDGYGMRLQSDRPALFVTLDAEGIAGEWSDNCLVLLPGRPVEVTFTPRQPTSPERVRESLRVRHLQNAH